MAICVFESVFCTFTMAIFRVGLGRFLESVRLGRANNSRLWTEALKSRSSGLETPVPKRGLIGGSNKNSLPKSCRSLRDPRALSPGYKTLRSTTRMNERVSSKLESHAARQLSRRC